jgi:hypothetical protein
MLATTWSITSLLRPLTITEAPCAASNRHNAAPIPRDPPVTTATRPSMPG